MEEEWRPIEGTDNNYYVSNLGRVKSVDRVVHYPDGKMRCFPGKLLAPVEMPNGYLRVHIRKPINKNKSVHRLVAQAFVKNDSGENCVNHIDGNKANNRWNNLEWCSAKENTRHAIRTGLAKYPTSSKPIIAYKGVNIVGVFPSISECSKGLNCDYSAISAVLHGRCKTHHGFTFKFVNSDDLDGGNVRDNATKVVAIKDTQVIKAKSHYELAKKLGVSASAVYFASKDGTKVKGYIIRKDVSTND